jgi:uncharacterized protein (TIGR02466 family)
MNQVNGTSEGWLCDTFNTKSANYNIVEDVLFSELIEQFKKEVCVFARHYGVHNKIKNVDGWINVAAPGEYQEYHYHGNSHFSLVYYIKSPENCGNLVVKSHESDKDMFYLPYSELTEPNYKIRNIIPRESDVVIFRSNLHHMVTKNKSKENRVSIAMNFVFEDNV